MRYKTHLCIDTFVKEYNHINYCEIAIGPEGEIHQLVNTSHQDMLCHIAYGKCWYEMTEEEAEKTYKELGDQDVLEFLVNKTGCCALWYYSMTIPRKGITEKQLSVINRLYRESKTKVNMKSTSPQDLPPNIGFQKIGRGA